MKYAILYFENDLVSMSNMEDECSKNFMVPIQILWLLYRTFYTLMCPDVFIDINTQRTIQIVLKNLKSDLSMRHTSEHRPILL